MTPQEELKPCPNEALVDKLRELLEKSERHLKKIPWRVIPCDGKPIVAGNGHSGNIFRGYIATWEEAELVVETINALPTLLDALATRPTSSPCTGELPMTDRCARPPAGWTCSRAPGHDGPCAASPLVVATGWASPSLATAYDAIDRLRLKLAQPTESPIDEALKRALSAIEDADEELVGIAS